MDYGTICQTKKARKYLFFLTDLICLCVDCVGQTSYLIWLWNKNTEGMFIAIIFKTITQRYRTTLTESTKINRPDAKKVGIYTYMMFVPLYMISILPLPDVCSNPPPLI